MARAIGFLLPYLNAMKTYEQLLEKLDAFIRKYYLNQIIRGILYFVAIGLASILITSVLEYYGRFSSGLRAVLFFGTLGVYGFVFTRFILVPAFKLFKLRKGLNHAEAAKIIGKHFHDVDDKLLNTIQLRVQQSQKADSTLILASIDQRIAQLQPIPFTSAVDFKENKRYLPYALIPLGLGAILLFVAPAILKDGTQRIVSFNREFIEEAPFKFIVLNDELKAGLNENFQLIASTDGEYRPSEMNLELDGKFFRMKKNENGDFAYTFRSVRNDIPFRMTADGFNSAIQILSVLPTPSVLRFEMSLHFPEYLDLPDQNVSNGGNIQIPEGTRVKWTFATQNTESLLLAFGDTSVALRPASTNQFSFQRSIGNSMVYRLAATNSIIGGKDTMAYQIDVTKDAFPRISAQESRDSLQNDKIYFGGSVSDDHGLKSLTFNYLLSRADGTSESKALPVSLQGKEAQDFYHFADFGSLGLKPGDKVEYFFEVWDNDGVNGSKSSRSARATYAAPTTDELDKARKDSAEDVKDKLEETIKKAAELQKELKDINKTILQKNEMSWQDKQRIENAINNQKSLQREVESLQQERKKSQYQQEKYSEFDERILEKQRQIDKLFDELMSDEMKKMYEELEKLIKELDQDKIREELEKLQLDNKDLEKDLDRTLELFKQLEFEKQFEESLEKLEKLAEDQEKLSKDSEKDKTNSEELKEKQEELNEKFEELQKELDELEKQNEELESPNNMPDTEKSEEKIQEEMEKSSEQLDQKKNKKASESQKSAAQEMQKMAEGMKSAMAGQQSQKQEEDMDALRALLENLIQLSFDQEDIMENLRQTGRDDPGYVELGQRQKKLEGDSKMVEDSLFALSKRVPQISSAVNREIGLVNANIAQAISEIGERMTANASARQQYVMTSYNNLALLLDEALQQMQEAMANQMPGKGNCENPGGSGSKPSDGKMGKMQDEMGKKLEKMKKELEKGKSPGGSKPGMGNQGMSKEIAQMAAEQAAIRKEIERMSRELNEKGKGEGKGLEEIAEQMEKNERDLVNQDITRETMRRQEEILTRLLESEKAQREREYDDKRESNQPRAFEPVSPQKYEEYNLKKAREIELLRTLPPDLKPYYKTRVNEYFLNFEDRTQ